MDLTALDVETQVRRLPLAQQLPHLVLLATVWLGAAAAMLAFVWAAQGAAQAYRNHQAEQRGLAALSRLSVTTAPLVEAQTKHIAKQMREQFPRLSIDAKGATLTLQTTVLDEENYFRTALAELQGAAGGLRVSLVSLCKGKGCASAAGHSATVRFDIVTAKLTDAPTKAAQ